MKKSIIFEKCNDGGYVAYLPDLPLCFSVGNTLSEAKELELNNLSISTCSF